MSARTTQRRPAAGRICSPAARSESPPSPSPPRRLRAGSVCQEACTGSLEVKISRTVQIKPQQRDCLRWLLVCPLSTSLRISLRVSLCQLCLATERPRFALKNGSSKWGTRESAIHHQVHCPVNRDHQAKWTCLINAGQVKISLTFQKSASGKRFRLTFQQSGLPSGIAKAACSHTSCVARDVEMSARHGG